MSSSCLQTNISVGKTLSHCNIACYSSSIWWFCVHPSSFIRNKQTKPRRHLILFEKGGGKYKQPTYLLTEIQSVVFGIIILLSYCFHNNLIIPPPINWIFVSNYVCYIYQTPTSATVHQRITFAHLCSSAVNFHSMILNQLFFFPNCYLSMQPWRHKCSASQLLDLLYKRSLRKPCCWAFSS